MGSNSKFVFALILLALLAGWIYMVFVPSHRVENNLKLNSNYFPGITPHKTDKP